MATFTGNPIFRREFLCNTRSFKTVFMTGLLLVGLSTILITLWPRSGVFSETSSGEVFTIFLNANLILLILLTPGFTATSITGERESGCYDLLFTSLLRPVDIMAGKLFSALSMAFLMLLVSLPVTAVCALSGGISLPTLMRTYAVISVATLTYCLLGLAASAVCLRSYASLAVTYLGILILAGATWLPAILLSQITELKPLFAALRNLSPFEALFALNYPERYELAIGGTVSAGAVFWLYLKGMAVVAMACFSVFCLYILKPPRRRQAITIKQYTDSRTALKRTLGFPFYLIDPLKRKKPISLNRNPVFVAEMRSKLFGNPKFIIRSVATCMIISMGLLTLVANQYGTTLDADKLRCVAIVFQIAVVALLAPVVSSGSITDEVSKGTLILMRMALLSPWRVVVGKMKASFLYVMIFLISSLPVLIALAYLESKAAYWRIGAWMGILLLTTVVLTAAGLCASTFAPNTGVATALSYGFAIFLCLGTLGILLLGNRISPELQAAILCFNPIVAALQITSDNWFSWMPSLFGYKLWQNNLVLLTGSALGLMGVAAWRVHRLFKVRT